MKFQYGKCLAQFIIGEDIVYSPDKYRETEGILRDRIKGVVAKPIPVEWLDGNKSKIKDTDSDEEIHRKKVFQHIAAKLKPYFFIYRYSHVKAKLDQYNKNVNSNCKIRFGKSLDELIISENNTEEEQNFVDNYEKYMPVSIAPGTMNRICWHIENEFKTTNVLPNVKFNKDILKNDSEYSDNEFKLIFNLYNEYNKKIQLVLRRNNKNEEADENIGITVDRIKELFLEECNKICPDDRKLSNIVIDICYNNNKNKTFAWDIAGEQIFNNVLEKNNNVIKFPIKDINGNITFNGNKFSLHEMKIGGDSNDI